MKFEASGNLCSLFMGIFTRFYWNFKTGSFIKGEALLTIGYANFSHVTIVFIAKYLFTGSVKILNKIVFKIAIKFISMRNAEISYCLYSEKFK